MTDLAGLRVLVVEDEGAVALMIEGMLQDLGCEIAASVARLADACKIAGAVEADLAVLDVNLGGQQVFPAAEILRGRQIPLVFSTGYGRSGVRSDFSAHPILSKPFSIEQLRQAIASALAD